MISPICKRSITSEQKLTNYKQIAKRACQDKTACQRYVRPCNQCARCCCYGKYNK